MTIEFKPVESPPVSPQPPQARQPEKILYIPPASKLVAEEQLFHFLCSLLRGRPRVQMPLVMEAETLRDLYADPRPDLQQALTLCVDQFLVEISQDTAQWGKFDLSPQFWGFALALHNALIPELVPELPPEEAVADSMAEFTHALIDTMPPARTPQEMLACHALLHRAVESLPYLPPSRAMIMLRLIHLSPLTGACGLHYYTPPALTPLAAEMIPGWKRRMSPASPWKGPDDWLNSLLPLIDTPAMARFLRNRWLAFPHARPVFRNLGLFLEALRRRGNHRPFILEFYEAFDHANGEDTETGFGGKVRRWPVLQKIEDLFRTGGDSEETLEAAMRMNRWGHEFFFLFHPLTQIIREEGAIPSEYNHLHPGWIPALRPLLDYIDDTPPQYFDMPDIAYESSWKGKGKEVSAEKTARYRVILHNDDVTTMDFVVGVLVEIFGKSPEESSEIMLKVHNEGTGFCGIFSKDEAREKVEWVASLAKEQGFPLKCTMEKLRHD